jgi:hypothetical protein
MEFAEAYHAKHGKWPTARSGKISAKGGGDTWGSFNVCLKKGRRGLPGGSSLIELLIENGCLPPIEELVDFSINQILEWADEHYAYTHKWPNTGTGIVTASPKNTWERLDKALRRGQRGLPRGTSLAQLLFEKRGAPNLQNQERLNIEKILRWVDAHYDRTGNWPTRDDGEVFDAPGETWDHINNALLSGNRGLPKGSSLPLLLAEQRGKRHVKLLPDLNIMQINGWVLTYYARTGRLPRVKDGTIPEAPDESWSIIDNAFRYGRRGLAETGYTSLKAFLDSYFTRADFGQRVMLKPKLYISTILKWADEHHARTGNWPNTNSGEIPDEPGETWRKINHEMTRGLRGINPPTTLTKLLEQQRGMRPSRRGTLTFVQILRWADEHRARTGQWPDPKSRSEIPGAPHETWLHVNSAMLHGSRGLPQKTSLPMLLFTYRGRPHIRMLPAYDLDTIESWVSSYREQYNKWPGVSTGGVVDEAPEESWRSIDAAFKAGGRGLEGCGYRSLDDFMIKRMGKPLSVHRGHWKEERVASGSR